MTSFNVCPACGAKTLTPDSAKSVRCQSCGFVYFFNAAAAVAALICNTQGQLLLTLRSDEPGKGLWDLPGGFVDPGESVEAALRREIAEELNLTVTSMTYLCSEPNTYIYKQVPYATLDMAFVCGVDDMTTMTAQEEIERAAFLPLGDIRLEELAFESTRRIITRYSSGRLSFGSQL